MKPLIFKRTLAFIVLAFTLTGCDSLFDSIIEGISLPNAKQVVERNGTEIRFVVNGTLQDFTHPVTIDYQNSKASIDLGQCPLDFLVTNGSNAIEDQVFWESLTYTAVTEAEYLQCNVAYSCNVTSYQEMPGSGIDIYGDCTSNPF